MNYKGLNNSNDDKQVEIVSLLSSLERTQNSQFSISDIINHLSFSSNSNPPAELKLIKYLSSDQKLLLQYVSSLSQFINDDLHSVCQSMEDVMTAVKEQIDNGAFEDVGLNRDCHHAIESYFKKLQKEWNKSTILPPKLSKLKMLLDIGNIDGFNQSLRDIFTEIKASHPTIFWRHTEREFLHVKIGHVLRIFMDVIPSGCFKDIGDESFCMVSISEYVRMTESEENTSNVILPLYDEIVYLASLDRASELTIVFRKMVQDIDKVKYPINETFFHQDPGISKESKMQVASIVSNVIKMRIYEDIGSRNGCLISLITFLLFTGNEAPHNNDVIDVAFVQNNIFKLNERGMNEELNWYIRKILIAAKTPFPLNELDITSIERGVGTSNFKIWENIFAFVATGFIAWLCTLHVLAPVPNNYKSEEYEFEVDYDIPYSDTLLNPSFSSWIVIGLVALAVAITFLVWNWFCILQHKKSLNQAIQEIIYVPISMATGDTIAYVTAYFYESISPAFWVTLSIFCLVGVGSYLILRIMFSQLVRILFDKLIKHKEIHRAYATLGMPVNAAYTDASLSYELKIKILGNFEIGKSSTTNVQVSRANQYLKYKRALEIIAYEHLKGTTPCFI